MNNRRGFMISAGGAAAATLALVKAKGDEAQARTIYLHGMVWNLQLAAPMNDWLIRLDAKVDVPIGSAAPPAVLGFATFGDDFHDPVSSHVDLQKATVHEDQISVTGVITESKTASLVGQTVRIAGKMAGTAVEGLSVAIGPSVFAGAGFLKFEVKIVMVKDYGNGGH